MDLRYVPNENYIRKPDSSDQGPNPLVTNISMEARKNMNYRYSLWTGTHMQITLMNINVNEDIGAEMHSDVDQYLYIEEGYCLVQFGNNRRNPNYQRRVHDGYAIVIPAGTWHNIINIGSIPLKIISVYAPPHHPKGTVHMTKKNDGK